MAKSLQPELCYSTEDLPFQHKVFPKSYTNVVLVDLFYVHFGECHKVLSKKTEHEPKKRFDHFMSPSPNNRAEEKK